MEKYFEVNKNGQNIRCKLYYEKGKAITKVILYGHGFAGHKDNGAARKFAERVLTKYRTVALITFDLPCHGDDVKKKLSLNDCLTYISLVLDHIKNEMGIETVYSYATSFGGYLVLRYISEFGNPFAKIALRCPAVNIYESMTRTIIKHDEYEEIMKGKTVPVGFDRKIDINLRFLDELKENDITKLSFMDYADDILIIQGTKDEIVSPDAVSSFADNNVIEYIPVKNADHRFQDPGCMEAATKAVLSFFEL